MKIEVAKTAGFCFGVNRAVNMVYDSLGKYKNPVTLGPIIHNRQVVDDLEKKGGRVIGNVSEADKSSTVIIRAHGVPKADCDYLEAAGISYIDTTCPFVKKIHNIVKKQYEAGDKIIIAGDSLHPEVIGINGWCENSAVIISSAEELTEDLLGLPSASLVSQTTLDRSVWKQIISKITGNNIKVFDTICSATKERQEEAEEIAKRSDAMIVIGGQNSSNTKKLVYICSRFCPAYHIESADQLPGNIEGENIGITAGASTPADIIKEVIQTMTEENTNVQGELNFADELEKSFKTLNTGDIVTGTVIGVTPTEVYVDLGAKADGFIPADELGVAPGTAPADVVKVGDEIDVFVVRVNDVEGTIQLSRKKIANMKDWEIMKTAMEEETVLEGKVLEVVNGGMMMLVNSLRVFIPASLANDRFMRDLTPLIGKELPLRIIDVNPRRHKVVGSVKSVLAERRAAQLKEIWENIEIGKKYKGVVKSLTQFGAFVDIGGVDGLIHISELSWKKIKHPSEIVNVGDIIDTFVIDFDKETGKISLGYKNPEDDPWKKVEAMNVGDIVKCKVVRLVPFGAFVEVVPEVDGLVHISQIADRHIAKPGDVLEIGQEVDAKILEIDLEGPKKKISLSIKQAAEPVAEETTTAETAEEAAEEPAAEE
ncbi:MAG: bifunctional 4-hydroxy-3-methylbut-2-enyl diphosphate reductase/30S ribosomal protein S1 [Clostridia bacterium]|nr:bifunctional 4-hydroxy-3-methylbut-2-enyl diphosphate reductase/30S ribosomal protein S1 [Clostridia bacterium]